MEVVVGNANSGRYRRLTPQERKQIISLAARGESTLEIGNAVCRSKSTVNQVLRDAGGVIRNRDFLNSWPDY